MTHLCLFQEHLAFTHLSFGQSSEKWDTKLLPFLTLLQGSCAQEGPAGLCDVLRGPEQVAEGLPRLEIAWRAVCGMRAF